jgi:hypothetical protein
MLWSVPILNIFGERICNTGKKVVGKCLSSAGKNQMKRDIYCISIHPELQPRTNVDGERMQHKSKNNQKQNTINCASCGKTFGQKEMKVSYDFERFYCFNCDDKR